MRCRRRGFTLVEILIVVIILGILAAIVIPKLGDVTTISRESNLRENLSKIRANIQVYRNQHAAFPAADALEDQLTQFTDFTGGVSNVRTGEYRYGPYLEQMPANPFSGTNDIRAAGDPADAFPPGDADGGWWYNPANGRFYADLADGLADREGDAYNRY